MRSEDTHLHAVLSVSISRTERVRLACFLRKKLRYVHRRVTTSRYGEMAGLVSGCGENFGTFINTQFKALIKHRKKSLRAQRSYE
jgi:hypothetical protein